jgi:hypothetical protein
MEGQYPYQTEAGRMAGAISMHTKDNVTTVFMDIRVGEKIDIEGTGSSLVLRRLRPFLSDTIFNLALSEPENKSSSKAKPSASSPVPLWPELLHPCITSKINKDSNVVWRTGKTGFIGFRRPSGKPCVRNHLAIISAMDKTSSIVRSVCSLRKKHLPQTPRSGGH